VCVCVCVDFLFTVIVRYVILTVVNMKITSAEVWHL